MIFTDSRYADGTLIKAQDSRTGHYRLGVYRKFPTKTVQYYQYVWVEGDRIDVIAQQLYGTSDNWHYIMDHNPEIVDPSGIAPGTLIRVPND